MNHVHFQPIGGAAGDMTLAALVAAGASLPEITALLRGLGVSFDLAVERVEVNGIGTLRAAVGYPEEHSHRTFGDIRASDGLEMNVFQDRSPGFVEACLRWVGVFGAGGTPLYSSRPL
ncbi:MAG TPA: nickel insertion protein, partial [Rubrobacter sp.]|nr:nickel insertion protein [Rubrobacter sp.]